MVYRKWVCTVQVMGVSGIEVDMVVVLVVLKDPKIIVLSGGPGIARELIFHLKIVSPENVLLTVDSPKIAFSR